jgi:thioredoxin reductase
MNHQETVDVLIIGGGPAGLSAAMFLGRCMRRVIICDAGEGESDPHASTSGFIGYDGCRPSEFLKMGRQELRKYETVTYLRTTVVDVERHGFEFVATCDNHRTYSARAVLLASDFVARPPAIPGAENFLGTSLHQCPYCDGWEHRNKRLGVIGADPASVDLALMLLRWSTQVSLFAHGSEVFSQRSEKRLIKSHVRIIPGTITALEGSDGDLELVRMEDGSAYPCDALFFSAPRKYHPLLAANLGLDLNRLERANHGDRPGETGIQGLYVAMNTFKSGEFAIIASAEGIRVGDAINNWLTEADQSYLAVQQFSHF